MSRIWATIVVVSVLYGLSTGRGIEMAKSILELPNEAFALAVTVLASASFWSGFMYIMQEVGLVKYLSRALRPLLRLVFPKLRDEEALGYISTNIAANMFGLGFAATPSGLKGIKRLKELSDLPPGVASDDMITFLVLNTAGVTLIPTSVMAIRQALGSTNPADFMLIGIIGTVVSSIVGITADRLLRRPYKNES